MLVDTRYFGEIDLSEEKIIHFEQGLFGFEEYKDFTILFDGEAEEKPFFSWLQCITEKMLSFPVVNPQNVREDYDPILEDALLEPLGECDIEDMVVLLLATIPRDVKEASVNMKAPLIINARTRQGIQVVAENSDYEVKHKILSKGEV